MTKLLESAVQAVRSLDEADQDWIASAILNLAGSVPAEPIEPGHLNDVEAGLDEARRGVFASEDEIEAAFGRFRG